MRLSEFDYELPEELIAQHPLDRRDSSRMLVLDRSTGQFFDSHFKDLPSCVHAGDIVVINNTRVFPAKLIGSRIPSGGQVELLLLKEVGENLWEVLARPARRVRLGDHLDFNESSKGRVMESGEMGWRLVKFESTEPVRNILEKIGQMPLPPYIKRANDSPEEDRIRYQTIYASKSGAIAAPTAGLHFTDNTFRALESRRAQIAEITLHVGYGTFEPVRVEDLSRHSVKAEEAFISEDAAARINETHEQGGRVFAVGTTTARALESGCGSSGKVTPGTLTAGLTIMPGYAFRVVDCLLTNFHLPRSSLLLLVSAFANWDIVREAYNHAINSRYRFYSYGDCMLII